MYNMIECIYINKLLFSHLSTDAKAIAQLCLLPYMISSKGRVCTNKSHWKPSMSESEESLVAHVMIKYIFSFIRNILIVDMLYRKNFHMKRFSF